MSRPSDLFLDGAAFSAGRKAPMVDIKQGGAFGHQPDFSTVISATPYVRRNLIARVIETPRGFDYLPDPIRMRAMFKALIELHPRSIEGFNGQLTIDVDSKAHGGAGEEFQVVTDVKQTRSAPSVNYIEKYGRPISNFYDFWIRELLLDPVTKIANVTTRPTYLARPDSDRALLPDFYGATVLFYEVDPTNTKVDKAWLCTNFFPTTAAPVEGSRDLTAANSTLEFGIEFAAITQQGFGVIEFAQSLHAQTNFTGSNPLQRQAFIDKLSAGALDAGVGYAEQLATMSRSVVQN